MYIQTQDKNNLISFDKYHELTLDEENCEIYAVYYTESAKIRVLIGRYKDVEAARKEYEDILDTLMKEAVIYEVD